MFYTLSLHDALPISHNIYLLDGGEDLDRGGSGNMSIAPSSDAIAELDRKSTRLNSSHDQISYAVFCLKKKKTRVTTPSTIPAHSSPRLLPPPSPLCY